MFVLALPDLTQHSNLLQSNYKLRKSLNLSLQDLISSTRKEYKLKFAKFWHFDLNIKTISVFSDEMIWRFFTHILFPIRFIQLDRHIQILNAQMLMFNAKNALKNCYFKSSRLDNESFVFSSGWSRTTWVSFVCFVQNCCCCCLQLMFTFTRAIN